MDFEVGRGDHATLSFWSEKFPSTIFKEFSVKYVISIWQVSWPPISEFFWIRSSRSEDMYCI